MDVFFNWRWWLIGKTYNIISEKVSGDIKKEFDSESVYNKIFLKTKIKSYDDEATR